MAKQKHWTFEFGEQTPQDQWEREGKIEWPDTVHVGVTKRQHAWEIVMSILHQLEALDDGCTGVAFSMRGLLGEGPREE